MPIVHMICGPIGAGKTTLARQLARDHEALRFSLDEWVTELFGREAPEPMLFEWWADRCERCRKRIWSVCRDVLARNVDVVLDFGFPSVTERDRYRALAAELGAAVHVHVVTATAAVRWERVLLRNEGDGETFALVVTEAMFVGSESSWQPPTPAELAGAITLHSTEGPPAR